MNTQMLTSGQARMAAYNLRLIEEELRRPIPAGYLDASQYADRMLTSGEANTIAYNISMATDSSDIYARYDRQAAPTRQPSRPYIETYTKTHTETNAETHIDPNDPSQVIARRIVYCCIAVGFLFWIWLLTL